MTHGDIYCLFRGILWSHPLVGDTRHTRLRLRPPPGRAAGSVPAHPNFSEVTPGFPLSGFGVSVQARTTRGSPWTERRTWGSRSSGGPRSKMSSRPWGRRSARCSGGEGKKGSVVFVFGSSSFFFLSSPNFDTNIYVWKFLKSRFGWVSLNSGSLLEKDTGQWVDNSSFVSNLRVNPWCPFLGPKALYQDGPGCSGTAG